MDDKIPDINSIERLSSELSKLLDNKEFDSEDDLKSFLDNIDLNKDIPNIQEKDATDMAQEILYDAWEVEDRKERIRLAKKALSISKDCADAYNLLAQEEARTIQKAKEYYAKGVEAGKRYLGEKIFKEDYGHFWGYVPSRPYMRSKAGLMECLWELGKHDEAIGHAYEMLRLNISDNQGIRYILIRYLLELGRYDKLEEFMNREDYRDDCAAEWVYASALFAFIKNGNSKTAYKQLQVALGYNKYVPDYLAGKKAVPNILPDRVTMGGEDEAYCYARAFKKSWQKVPGAISWLKEETGIKKTVKVGRNDPCPCGSGKKYKKCCGS